MVVVGGEDGELEGNNDLSDSQERFYNDEGGIGQCTGHTRFVHTHPLLRQPKPRPTVDSQANARQQRGGRVQRAAREGKWR